MIQAKKIIIIFTLLVCTCQAQLNLVPNCSFENYFVCPNGNNINNIIGWFQPNIAGNSSDAFNSCNNPTNSYLGVPTNFTYQFPKYGNGYAGIAMYFDSTTTNTDKWREYIEVKLTDSLKANKRYCIRFYTVKGNSSIWAVKNIQAVLTNDSLLYNDPNYVYIQNVTPMMEADSIITDTLNWIKVEKNYSAIGGEKFITIGNFNSGATVNRRMVLPYNSTPNTLGYYLIDDVSVYEQPDINAGADTLINPSGVAQLGIIGRPDVFYTWLPTTGLSNPNIANPIANPTVTTTYTLMVSDTNQLACNNVFYDTVTVTVGFVGVKNTESKNKTKIYPNPVKDELTIELESAKQSTIQIKNMLGEIVYTKQSSNTLNKINTSEFSTGIYFTIILDDENKIYCTNRFVKD